MPPELATEVQFTGAALHPDGLVWSTAGVEDEGKIYLRMWDFRQPKVRVWVWKFTQQSGRL